MHLRAAPLEVYKGYLTIKKKKKPRNALESELQALLGAMMNCWSQGYTNIIFEGGNAKRHQLGYEENKKYRSFKLVTRYMEMGAKVSEHTTRLDKSWIQLMCRLVGQTINKRPSRLHISLLLKI